MLLATMIHLSFLDLLVFMGIPALISMAIGRNHGLSHRYNPTVVVKLVVIYASVLSILPFVLGLIFRPELGIGDALILTALIAVLCVVLAIPASLISYNRLHRAYASRSRDQE
jgi:O-antigen/teichoic acid export membrane protein